MSSHAKNERSFSPSPSPSHFQRNAETPQKKVKYIIPTGESYNFRVCSHPIEEICGVTNYMRLIPDDFKNSMLMFICQEGLKGSSVYGEYQAPPNTETVEKINGKGGYFLKKTADESNTYLIWYNRKRNIYMFWGALENEVRSAMNRIRGRIIKYIIHIPISSNRQEHQNNRNIADSPPPVEEIE